MRFLTCEPNLAKDPGYLDEADIFYNDPIKWLNLEIPDNATVIPSHLVMFNRLQKDIKTFLVRHKYKQCAQFFHTHVPEGRTGTHVQVFCQKKKKGIQM